MPTDRRPPPYLVPLLVLMTLQTTAIACLLAPPIFAVAALADLRLSVEWVGAYPFFVYAAAILSATFAGGLTANVGPIRASQYCLSLVGVGICLFAAAHLWLMVLGSLFIGAGYGPLTAAGSDLLKQVTPQRLRPVIFSVRQTAIPVGGALAGATIPALVNLAGWRATAFIFGAVCIVLAVVAQALRARLDSSLPRSSDRSLLGFGSLRLVARNSAYLLLGAAALCFAFAQSVLFTYLVPYLSEELGLTLVAAGAVLAAAQLGGAGGRIVWGVVATWLNSAKPVLVGLGAAMAVASGATALFTQAWPFAGILAVSILFGITAVGWNGVFLAEVAHVAPAGGVGALTGAMSSLAFLGLMIGPPLFGVLIKATQGYFLGFMVVAAMTLTGSALVTRMTRPG